MPDAQCITNEYNFNWFYDYFTDRNEWTHKGRFMIYIKSKSCIVGDGLTEELAWEKAWNTIQNKMVEKLEQ